MKLKDIRRGLTAVLRERFPECVSFDTDTKKPVMRGNFKLDIYPVGCGALCGGSRERSVDVDIWYYAPDEHKCQDNCGEVSETLMDALYCGFEVDGITLYPDDDMTCEQVRAGVLVCQFGLTWYETLVETGEPMEELNLSIDVENDMEVLSYGSDDAEG